MNHIVLGLFGLLAVLAGCCSSEGAVRFPLTSHIVMEPLSPEQEAENEHLMLNRRRALGTFTVVPLIGITTVVFSAEMAIGTPPQNLTCIVDTGSANLAVAASRNAAAPQYFNTSASSSYQDLGSSFSTNYLSGSWTGERSSDLFKFAATSEAQILALFAAITSSSGFFRSPAALGVYGQYAFDGILGMGFSTLANPPENPITPFFDTYVAANNITDVFTVQLCDFQVVNGNQLAARQGNLVLGGAESDVASLAVGAFFYVSIVEKKYYEVKMTGISVGGTRLSNTCDMYNSPNNAFLDSGTTNIIVPQTVFDQLRSSMTFINSQLSASDQDLFYGGNACITMPQNITNLLPNVTIHIASETAGFEHNFVVRPWQYLRATNASTGNLVCRSWGFTASCNTILGAVFMDGYTVLHDRTNMRMGIAASTCGVQNPVVSTPAITTTALPSGFDITSCKPSDVCNSAAQLVPALSTVALALLSALLVLVLW